MPPIEHNGKLVFYDIDKSDLFNKFFCEQSTLDDSDNTPPDITELQTDGLRQILITETEVEDILKIVESSKATGPDCINPRLLREAAPILKYSLCKFSTYHCHCLLFHPNENWLMSLRYLKKIVLIY